jgi:hypothetical protein
MQKGEASRSSGALAVGLVFLAALLLFAFGASQREIWRNDEHRYVEVGRVMTLPGASVLVPHLDGAPYTHKPPLFFWGVAAFSQLGLEPGGAGMAVSALASAVTIALCFALGRRLWGPREGLAAAVVLASAGLFSSLAFRANLDAALPASPRRCTRTGARAGAATAPPAGRTGCSRRPRGPRGAGEGPSRSGSRVCRTRPSAAGPLGMDRGRALVYARLAPGLACLAAARRAASTMRDLVIGRRRTRSAA